MIPFMQIFQYKYSSDRWFKLGFSLFIILLVGMTIVSKNECFQLSAFISHPQHFPLPLNEWAIECGDRNAPSNLTIVYLVFDSVFPFILAFVLILLVKGVTKAAPVNGTKDRLFQFNCDEFNFASKVAFCLLVPAVTLDLVENFMVYDTLVLYGTERRFTPSTYACISDLKMFFYLLPSCLVVGSFVYVYWLDFGKYWKKYFWKLYPSFLGVLFSLLIFAFFTQAFDFIVELVEPINLIAFLTLFVFALIGLWMTPYYLGYTENAFFKDLTLGKILKYTIIPLTDPNLPKRPETIDETYGSFQVSEQSLFHAMRRGIAIAFIVVFLLFQLNLLREICGINDAIPGLVVTLNVIGMIAIYRFFLAAKRSDLSHITTHKDKSDRLTDKRLNKESKLFRLGTSLFWVIVINALLAVGHVTLCLATNSMEPKFLVEKLILSISHGFLFSWSFFIYVLFRKVKLSYSDFRFSFSKSIYTLIRKVSYTPLLMTSFFLFSGLMLGIILLLLVTHSPWIEQINPLNLFLIILTSFIASIALLGRIIIASLNSKRIRFGPRSAGRHFNILRYRHNSI